MLRRFCLLLVLFVFCLEAADDPAPAPAITSPNLEGKACIAKAKGRGVGSALSSCPNGTEKDGMLCYKSCSEGYHGVGPVCWKSCPGDSRDLGVACLKTYGKGCCCTVFGCCGGCKEGYKDSGCFCRKGFVKHSYGRGAGAPLRCSSDQEQNGGLCYKPCAAGFQGDGPVCWEEVSPPAFPHRCNRVLYTTDRSTCEAIDSEVAKTGSFAAACVALAIAFAATSAGTLLPAASFFCGKSFDSAVGEVQQIIDLTHAKSCTP